MGSSLSARAVELEQAGVLAELINTAYDDWRALERVTAYAPIEPPRVSAESLRQAAERGDLEPEASRVLWDGGEPVGLVGLGVKAGSQVARLGWVAVRPDYRRRGLGSQLVRYTVEQAREGGCRCLVTGSTVDSRYQPALGLLEKVGMRWVDRERCNLTLKVDVNGWQPTEPVLPEGFSLRTWQDGDEPVWTELKCAIFEDHTPIGYWSSRFGSQPDFDPAGWHFCLDGDKPVGICAAVLTRYLDCDEVLGCCIEWVGVLPQYRGLGLGRAMMAACLNYAYPYRPEPFVLVTQPFRAPAVKLYESLGFRIVREWRTYQHDL